MQVSKRLLEIAEAEGLQLKQVLHPWKQVTDFAYDAFQFFLIFIFVFVLYFT